ncbi:MAG TPA: nuclear transport factor 2 family protein [Paracoccaceae bacterium]|nr:nuclear transport factor 2 family protein [Paracoccaceae bacterium]
MRFLTLTAAAMLLTGCNIVVEDDPDNQPAATGENSMPTTPPMVPADHAPLLASTDPRLAANKRLVYDMYRIVLQAGLADRADEFIRQDYIQHNPMAAQGLAGVQEYIRNTRPERDILDKLELPMVNIMAEGDFVTIAFVRPETGPDGATYYSTWFDMFRIQDGKIAEHWDPMLKTDTPIDPNSKRIDN